MDKTLFQGWSFPAMVLSAALFSLALTGCDGETSVKYNYPANLMPAPVCGQGAELTTEARAIADALSDFGFELAETMNAASSGDNILISPASIAIALGMTWNGAKGVTEQEMRDVLNYGELTADQVRKGYRDLLSYLSCTNSEIALEYANAIWYRSDLEALLVPEFESESAASFFAPIAKIPADDPVGYINGWISERTHEKIQDLIDEIDPNVAMLLVNALYFKAAWQTEFMTLTENGSFAALSGEKDIALMSHEDATDYPYVETDAYQAVRLDYKGGSHAMTVILPKEGTSVDNVLTDLSREAFSSVQKAMKVTNIELTLPRFKVEYGTALLNDGLKALGMVNPFDPNSADFSGIFGDHPVFISRVMHKAFVAVTEQGTEAAAATVIEVKDTAATLSMIVNRPFLFLIHDNATNTVLFLGKVMNPERAEAN